MRKWIHWIVLALVLCVVNGLIAQKEHVRRSGQRMLLRLAPVDPRSLMQGDYMVLRYAINAQVPDRSAEASDGHLVVKIDDNDVASFVRVHAGEPLGEGEHLLRYRIRSYEVRLGAESFFFQEGHAEHYEGNARYGELRVTPSGDSVLVGLCGEKFERLEPPREGEKSPESRPDDSGA